LATGGSINFSILANDQGPIDSSSVSVGSVTGGSVTTLGSSGRIRFDAEPDFNGTTSFTYTVCATDGSCASATVTIDVG
jgi:hypothetical protein